MKTQNNNSIKDESNNIKENSNVEISPEVKDNSGESNNVIKENSNKNIDSKDQIKNKKKSNNIIE